MNTSSVSEWHLGRGKYSCIMKTTFERIVCAVKAIERYRDRPDNENALHNKEADDEERGDISTEVAILSNANLRRSLDWNWLPKLYATFAYKELSATTLQTVMRPLGFTPAALFYMELLDEQLDHYIQRVATTATGANEALKLMCDLLATVIALSRHGVRHNDMMFRNIMVRRRKTQTNCDHERVLKLKIPMHHNAKANFRWKANTTCDLVVIDFGLSSVDESSPLAAVPFIITHTTRDRLYASNPTVDSNAVLHPLVLPRTYPLRPCIDIHCIAHSLRHLASKETLHKSFRDWCSSFIKVMKRFHEESYNSKRCPSIEYIVSKLIPKSVCT